MSEPRDLCYVFCAMEGSPVALPTTRMPGGTAPRMVPLDPALTLVVAGVPADVYSPEALEPRLGDLDWVGAAGAAHHEIVDALAEGGATVLPFRLFTLFSSEKNAVTALAARRDAMNRALERVRGRQEWVLRIGVPDPAKMTEPQASTVTTPPSGTSFLQGRANSRREAASRATRVKEDAAAAFESLEQLSDAARMRPIESGGGLLIDAAFLLPASRVDAMREALTKRAARLLQDGCPVSLTGPWPPYSFSSLDVGNE